MDLSELLLELYGRIPPLVAAAVDGLSADELATSPSPDANTIGWLTWHLARVQDHHVAELLDTDQIWVEGDWAARVGVAADSNNTGYGHDRSQMQAIRPDGPDVLVEYLDAVQRRTTAMLRSLGETDLDGIVDERWNPPVTMGVRLISIADDSLQHAGQAAYVRGLLGR
jgi:hypothetical protein